MKDVIFISAGGIVGSLCRHFFNILLSPVFTNFPFHTFTVNSIGSFLIGLSFYYVDTPLLPPEYRLLIVTGFLGAFTTFSSLSIELYYMVKTNNMLMAFCYAIGSVIIGIGMTFFGYKLGEILS